MTDKSIKLPFENIHLGSICCVAFSDFIKTKIKLLSQGRMAFITVLGQWVVFFFSYIILLRIIPLQSISKVSVSICCGTSCVNYSTSRPHGPQQNFQFLLWDVTSLFHHLQVLKHVLGGHLVSHGVALQGWSAVLPTVHYGHCSLLLCSQCILLQMVFRVSGKVSSSYWNCVLNFLPHVN